MKKILTFFLALSGTLIINAQNGSNGSNQKWSQNGDAVSDGAWAGTTNAKPLILKANNNTGIKITPDGDVVFKPLDLNSNTGPNGMVLTDGRGKIYRLNLPNDATKVLLGNGTFGSFNAAGQWVANGNDLYWNTGSVGVGMVPSGQFKLEVQGDARISHDLFINNNLFVGGGVVISDKIQGVTEVKGWDFKVENDLQVTGSTRFNGTTQLDQGLTFDGSTGIKYVPNNNGGGTFRYGKNNAILPLATVCAAQPYSPVNHQFGGWVQIFDADVNGNYVPGSGLLNLQTWAGGSSIDASIGGSTGSGGLLLNYFCGNNTFINTGVNGGRVSMGNEVEANRNVRIGYFGNDPFEQNTSLLVAQSTPNANAIKFYTFEPTVKLLSIQSPGLSSSPFNLFGDGHVVITTTNSDAFTIKSPNNIQVTHFKVKNTGAVYARSINVTLNAFPDYVFADEYKLMPLDELEKYIKTNKHLPSLPKEEEILKDGADLGVLQKLNIEKTEELTLYVIQLKKELEALKLELKETQSKIK